MIGGDTQAVVLAAGRSRRFNAQTSKLLAPLCGQEMVIYVTKALEQLGIETTVVIGYQKEAVRATIEAHHAPRAINFVVQEAQEGTGHAVACTRNTWSKDHILIMNGDMPLVTPSIIEALWHHHFQGPSTVTIGTAYSTDPRGAYGRIVCKGSTVAIVEAKEFVGTSVDHPYINAGIYLIERVFLQTAIETLVRHESGGGEFYITDIIKAASDAGAHVSTVNVPFDCVRGINTPEEFCVAHTLLQERRAPNVLDPVYHQVSRDHEKTHAL